MAANEPPEEAPTPDTTRPQPQGRADQGESPPNNLRWTFGVFVVVAGLSVVAFCFAVALYVYRNVASATDSATAHHGTTQATLNDTVNLHQGIAIGSSFHPSPHTRIEPVRYPRGSSLMGLFSTVLVDGGPSDAEYVRGVLKIHEILGVPPSSSRGGSRTGF